MTGETYVALLCFVPPILLFMFITDAIFIGLLIANMRAANKVKPWTSTPGTMVTSQMKFVKFGRGGGRTPVPVVEYSYHVNGQAYTGSRLFPAAGSLSGGSIFKKVMARYPVGAQVDVYYDPQNPEDSVLEKKSPAVPFLFSMLIIFTVILCAAIPFTWLMVRQL